MIIKLTNTTLKPALQNIIGSVPKKSTIPAMQNVMVQVNDDSTITLTGSDLEQQSSTVIHADETSGDLSDFTLPGQKFNSIVKSLPDDASVRLKVEAGTCTLTSGRSRFKLHTLPAADYSLLQTQGDTITHAIEQGKLKAMIRNANYAMAVNDVRYYLNGMLFEMADQSMNVVATDGHRLSVCTTSMESGGQTSAIIPRKAVAEIHKLLSDSDDLITLTVSDSYISVDIGQVSFSCKLLQGKFPDYNRVIPQNNDLQAVAKVNELRSALTRASVLSDDKFKGVRLAFENDTLSIETSNPQNDQANEEVGLLSYNGGKIEAGFNVTYINDVLAAMEEDEVSLRLKDGQAAMLIETTTDSCSCKNVIMPMRL